jgi:hypothetical protein
MKPQRILAIGLAAMSPGFGGGEAIQSRQAGTKSVPVVRVGDLCVRKPHLRKRDPFADVI